MALAGRRKTPNSRTPNGNGKLNIIGVRMFQIQVPAPHPGKYPSYKRTEVPVFGGSYGSGYALFPVILAVTDGPRRIQGTCLVWWSTCILQLTMCRFEKKALGDWQVGVDFPAPTWQAC